MRKKIISFLAKTFFYDIARDVIFQRIGHSQKMTPQYLIEKGFIEDDGGFYIEPFVKDRDKIWVKFESHYYRVFHGPDRTFIALKIGVDWFDNYYSLIKD